MSECLCVLPLATLTASKLDQLTVTVEGKVYGLLYAPVSYAYFVIIEQQAIAILSNRVRQINIETRLMIDDNIWPPEQPANFTPLLLVRYQGHHVRTPQQVNAMAKLIYTGDIGKAASVTGDSHKTVLDTGRATKEIEEILAPLEKNKESSFILIEGAPGIGKSVLLKEIAYRWGNKQLLKKFELVLLVCLRDPLLEQIKSVPDLLQLFYKGEENTKEVVSTCNKYLSKSGGKTLALLLDGYDEYPKDLQKCSLIASIIKREVLPHCGLVLSSRPHASENFHKQATIRVDILGFTETEREHYIKQALQTEPDKIKELTQYLHQQPSVDSICFIPFNMVILIYLYKLGISLPRNSTEMYQHFIRSTICRHLSKLDNAFRHNITDLTNLPEPYNRTFKQLSKLALEALNSNKLIFTLDEITAAFPDIPGAINGFGLLQAVQHFGLCGKTMTLNFIHFTIQEFLAAHYLSQLPPNEELKVIKLNFWNDIHFNMFSIYTSLTKGQRSSFKEFLSDGNKAIVIADKFLKDQLKCICLYRCFNEADDHPMCNTIIEANIFESREIKLGHTILTTSDMQCISLFLASSINKQWEWLNLSSCHIRDKGLNILYRGLRHCGGVIINQLGLDNNNLTTQSSTLISEFTAKCKVKKLIISHNYTIGENQQLYAMLTDPYNSLEEINMYNTKLSVIAAIALFDGLKDNNRLKVLYIDNNVITDDACNAITTALESNSCLVKLSMYRNPLTSDAIEKIVQCLEVNNTLQLLGLPDCPQSIEHIREVVNKKRESRGCRINLEIKFYFL